MSTVRRAYDKAIVNFICELAGVWSHDYRAAVEQAIENAVRQIVDFGGSQKLAHYAKGDVAEAWHTGTINIDASRLKLTICAKAPRDSSPFDVLLVGTVNKTAQIKYFRSPEDTAKAISHPKYIKVDQKVVPADQLDQVREKAFRLASRNAQTRNEVANSCIHTANTADDRLRLDGAESRPLSEADARELVKQVRAKQDLARDQFGLTPEQVIQWQDIIRETTTAASRALIIGAALQSAPYLLAVAMKAWEAGEISANDFAPLVKAAPTVLFRSGVSGGLSAAIISSARAGALGTALRQIDPTLVAACTTLAISTFEAAIRASRREITWPVAAKCISGDAITLAGAMGGAALGQAVIPIPFIGGLIGNLAGALVARSAVEGTHRVALGIAARTGRSCFGIIDQNYTTPSEILAASGCDVLQIRKLSPLPIELKRLQSRTLELKDLKMNVMRRGATSFGRVTYLT